MKSILFIFVILILSLTGCESKSGKKHRAGTVPISTLVEYKPVKAVVLYEQHHTGSRLYKIKLIDKGVVAYCTTMYSYADGDTIMVKPLEIKY
jgi:hypothetical protein